MRTVEWRQNQVRMIDQKRIPWELTQVDIPDFQAVAGAITDMTVRGAPAIGALVAFAWHWRPAKVTQRQLSHC